MFATAKFRRIDEIVMKKVLLLINLMLLKINILPQD